MTNEAILSEKFSLAIGLTITFGERELYSMVQEMIKIESVAHIYEEEKLQSIKPISKFSQENKL